jgi:Cu(I)/Ag(I) efflux system periplasmic protein CusF
MPRIIFNALLSAVLLFPVTLAAHDGPHAARDTAPRVKGTIEKIDTATGKIAINHEDIPNLKLEGGMTMMFKAADPALLTSVKVGDKVRFTADRVNGELTVKSIEKAK